MGTTFATRVGGIDIHCPGGVDEHVLVFVPQGPHQRGQLLLRPHGDALRFFRPLHSFRRTTLLNSFGSSAAAAAATARPVGCCSFTANAITITGGVHHIAQQHYTARDSAVQLSAAETPHEDMLSEDAKPPVGEKYSGKKNRVRYGISLNLTGDGMTRGRWRILHCTVLARGLRRHRTGTRMRWTICAFDFSEDYIDRPYLKNQQTCWSMIPICNCAARYRALTEPLRSVYSKGKGMQRVSMHFRRDR